MIKVYKYGLLPPTTNEALILEQISKAHKYRNILVEIERERRELVAAVVGEHTDIEPIGKELIELKAKRDELREAIKKKRATTRTRSDEPDQRQAVRDMGIKIRECVGRLKVAKTVLYASGDVTARLKAIDDRAKERIKIERAACGVYWGTYLLAEQDIDAAKREKTPPHFKRWTGDGRISVQLQGGLGVPELWGVDTQIQIDPLSPDAHDEAKPRGVRKLAQRTRLRMRVQSDASKKPIWAEWPMIMHRPIPEGARIKVATVTRYRRDCRRWDWELHLTVDIPEPEHRVLGGEGVVALNLGWCASYEHLNGGLRAGFLLSDKHESYEATVAFSVIDRIAKSESLQSIRDKNKNEMHAKMSAWFDGREDLPVWLKERIQYLHAWKSPNKFASLARQWRANRFEGDNVGYETLEAWRYRDEHLQRYEAGMLRSAILDRREKYRLLAARMADQYRTLIIDTTDLSEFQRSPRPEEERIEIDAVKLNQRRAAAFALRGALVNAFRSAGKLVIQLKAGPITMPCHACGQLDPWDRIRSREHTCSNCSATWDQDWNACANLLKVYRETGDARVVTKEVKKTRSQRLQDARRKGPSDSDGAVSS